ncbi:LLM class flavin-dependent oxidoreductase [Granulicella sp. dw_53]|uniref:LLM class flavin-dependent oxidoreductase n=1 Tax=Granulicella sp. dw_53 TaxID=2719792 RepID=UPI001BD64CDD|nr:LLM class flavin-dependent oxidoreductase [Granulicella sp. dw_53]
MKTPIFSALDFVMVRQGDDAGKAIAQSVELARYLEKLGYHRFWVPEHHGVESFASANPAVLIGHIAGATKSIRVGAGGVMLFNHPPLVIAEQFGTLASIYPGRIDLGVGRAVGSATPKEPIYKEALRRDPQLSGDSFPRHVAELQLYFGAEEPDQQIRAYPGQNTNVPIYLLSSSGYNAQLAGELGLPLAFATHIKPDNLIPSVKLYREHFRPSKFLSEPYVMVTALALAADTDEEAHRSFTSVEQLFLASIRNGPPKLPPKVDSMDGLWSEEEKQAVGQRMKSAILGDPATVRRSLQALLQETQADELMLWSTAYDPAERFRSYEILAEAVASLQDQSEVDAALVS